MYRNFSMGATRTSDGALIFDDVGGVMRTYHFGAGDTARPQIPPDRNVFAQRNAIPFFGAGRMAEFTEEEILSRADPDDLDGDGISGRPNWDRGFVGRFGSKAQVVSIEGFIRGPLFNHMGITTAPLTEEQRALLPVDSSLASVGLKQAAAPEGPNFDEDDVPDPEMSTGDLFDLVSFSMLLGLPEPEPLTWQTWHGAQLFEEIGCAACHVPALNSFRGDIPLYSDLLLHDMGEGLADGMEMGVATGAEFRTQPLIGIAAVGPYLHDGRAETVYDAILAHGGESLSSRDRFVALQDRDQDDLIAFLYSLGGRSQFTPGLLPDDTPIPPVGEYGGPFRKLSHNEKTRFVSGREIFDRDFGHATGVGALTGPDMGPRYNGDSCRACHFDPVIGGAGPQGVNVIRHGILNPDGSFAPPPSTPNTILHKEILAGFNPIEPSAEINIFEHRQTPHAFGLGLLDAIPETTIMSNADPNDENANGISGRAHILSDGRVGRLGWKAQVPSTEEFVRDAMAAEVGLTLPPQPGLTFGITQDTDDVPDPELFLDEAEDIAFFLKMLAPPPRQPGADTALAAQGEMLFNDPAVGCALCHIPALQANLDGVFVDVRLYSDLLLHEFLPPEMPGIEDGDASMHEFRTAPLWGLSQTAPYTHTGEADTINEAIRLHDGESASSRDAYINLTEPQRNALLAFLNTL